jgi:hypothetical protein
MKNVGSNQGKFWLKVLKRKMIPDSLFWRNAKYKPPSPQHIKTKILTSHSLHNATWVETGTYLGDTTLELSKIAKKVISIEPQTELYAFAKIRLGRYKNVSIVNETSENSITKILETIDGPTCFWLDGHYSGDVTYQGKVISPIADELASISKYLSRENPTVVFIDDFRLFSNSSSSGYPSQLSLVEWASENKLNWTIEHDIFIAKSM